MGDFGFISVFPFAAALFLLIWKEDLVFPLVGALFVGSIIVSKFNPYHGFMNSLGLFIAGGLFQDANLLTLLIVAEGLILYAVLSMNGSVSALVKALSKKLGEKNRLEVVVAVSSLFIFLDRQFSAFLVGIFTRPFAEKRKLAPVKHAYLLNTVSSSVSTLVPFSALMPLVLSSVGSAIAGVGIGYSPIKAFARCLPYQFYNIFSLFILLSAVLLEKDVLLMRRHTETHGEHEEAPRPPSFLSFGCSTIGRKTPPSQKIALFGMVASLGLVFASISLGLTLSGTGPGEPLVRGTGNHRILFAEALFTGIVFSILYTFAARLESYREFKDRMNAVPRPLLVTILVIVLAFAVGVMADRLNLSASVMGFLNVKALHPRFLPLIVFLFASLIGFLSGSSPFTIASVMPIAVRLLSRNMTDPLIVDNLHFAVIGAVLSGASFGDMNSPFSVTFLISTAASEASVAGHFRSQIGYSFIAVAVTVVAGYLLLALNIKPYLSIAVGALLIGSAFVGLNRTK